MVVSLPSPRKYTQMNAMWLLHISSKKRASFEGTETRFHFNLFALCIWLFWIVSALSSLQMGGEPRKQEPKNCDDWKARKDVWKILQKGNVTTYLERLHGFKPHITMTFFKNWSDDRVTLHGVTVKLTEDFIAEIMGLPTVGIKFTKQTSILNAAYKKFPKTEAEEKQLEKSADFFDVQQIKEIWRDVLCCIREYFILDGRNKRVHKCHFVFLNHFMHKDRLSFPFYLRFSLLHNLQAHKKKESRPILHEGLILLIEGYCKNKSIASTPSKDKHKDSHYIKSKKEETAKGKEKALNLNPSASQKQSVEEDPESENTESPNQQLIS